MTLLLQFSDASPREPVARTDVFPELVERLAKIGVRFERWEASVPLPDDATPDAILSAYAADIDRLKRERGYKTADVVRLKRSANDTSDTDWAAKAKAARAKFLEEHTHSEDEVRFFVEGSGMFCLHIDGQVYQLVCERGDLLSVPAGTLHWFDMGTDPAFCAIRVFGSEAGWAAEFTGDKLASGFPSFDEVTQRSA
jgi:1,2-dihydroxy-3-keto-5-methylthiopentene dioxygenase